MRKLGICRFVFCAAIVGAAVFSISIANAQGPTTRPTSAAARVQYVMSDLRTQDTPGVDFLCTSQQATGANLQATIDSMLPKLTKLAKLARNPNAPIVGPCMFVYHQAGANGTFTIDAGFPVQPNTSAIDGFTIKHLEPATCATVDYHGNAKFLPQAHEKLLAQITSAGNQPGSEIREIYLHFSAAHASDVRLQVPLAGRESILAGHRTAE